MCKLRIAGGPVIDLSKYAFETIRRDEDFSLYRARSKHGEGQILVLSPVTEYPAPQVLKSLEHAYSLKDDLDSSWAARPIAICREMRPALVLEDPGGLPLDQLGRTS